MFVGLLASSIALVGFGLDSFVESLSGGAIIWRFRRHGNMTMEEEEEIESKAIRLIANTFFILGFYILCESVEKLCFHDIPSPILLGIIIAAVSIIVMPVLFYMKYQTGKSVKSKSLIADSKQTLACMFMSVALLAGLCLNYLYGLWWADPVVGLIIVIFLLKEGYVTLREGKICSC